MMTLTQLIEGAKRATARSKSIKPYALRKADRKLQQIEIPKGYLIATQAEIDALLEDAGKRHLLCNDDEKKHIWYLDSHKDFGKRTYTLTFVCLR